MSDIVTGHDGSILTIQLNRPLHDAASDDHTRVVLWHGAGDSFTAATIWRTS